METGHGAAEDLQHTQMLLQEEEEQLSLTLQTFMSRTPICRNLKIHDIDGCVVRIQQRSGFIPETWVQTQLLKRSQLLLDDAVQDLSRWTLQDPLFCGSTFPENVFVSAEHLSGRPAGPLFQGSEQHLLGPSSSSLHHLDPG